jgi:hypothetical protein
MLEQARQLKGAKVKCLNAAETNSTGCCGWKGGIGRRSVRVFIQACLLDTFRLESG